MSDQLMEIVKKDAEIFLEQCADNFDDCTETEIDEAGGWAEEAWADHLHRGISQEVHDEYIEELTKEVARLNERNRVTIRDTTSGDTREIPDWTPCVRCANADKCQEYNGSSGWKGLRVRDLKPGQEAWVLSSDEGEEAPKLIWWRSELA